MKRSTFLPVFFLVLGVVFAGSVWMRLRAYDSDETAPGPREPVSAVAVTARAEQRHAGAGVVTESSAGEQNANAQTSSASRSREERYNELLRAAPPAAPAAAKEPSLFERVVGSAASALGISRSKPAAAAAAQSAPARTPQSQSQPPAQQAQADSHRGDDTSTRAKEPRGEEQDEETDIVPPQLMSADFNPPQVQDEGETQLSVRVSDNLSGVRGVSGVISSPSGALQGFACQREGEGDRFIARIKVPKDAAEGVWAVKYLTLSDNANNSINLNQGAGALPGTATFRVVSSGSDSTAPVLKSVYLEKRAMNAGEKNTVFVQADDEKSGVAMVSGVFVSPSKQARIGFGCRPGQGGAWECTVAPPACLDCGTWQLEQVQIQDKANNMATFRGDNPIVSQVALDITGDQCDAGPPRIVSLTLSPLVVSNAEGGTVDVAAVVQDDACGVASLSGQAYPSNVQGGQRIYFSFDPSQDGQNFFGRIVVPKFAAKGTWVIGWIQALDKGHNLRAYSSNDPVLSRVTFRVE